MANVARELLDDTEVAVSKVLFETKSARVNSVRIRSNVICAGLQNGIVQVWHYNDYALPAILACRFRHSVLPVRGVDIHPNLRHVVSGGDDFEIKLWDCSTTFSDDEETREPVVCFIGHCGVVRSVQFHPRETGPSWLVSCSEDKTVRMWNFAIPAGRAQCLRTFVGHTDAVTCAEFHPMEDLIVSSSLDQTVCVWDTAFGCLKFHLTGHTDGVKSVAFHPTLPLIVSTGDDRQVKLWRIAQSKAWEVFSLYGFTDNGSSCLMTSADLALGCGEDGTIRFWHLSTNKLLLTIRLERTRGSSSKGYGERNRMFSNQPSRLFAIAENPTRCNVLAAAHDSGFIVFEIQVSTWESIGTPWRDPNFQEKRNAAWSAFLEKRKSMSLAELNSDRRGSKVLDEFHYRKFLPAGEITMPPSCMPIIAYDLDYDVSGIKMAMNRMRNVETSLKSRRDAIGLFFSLLSCFALLSLLDSMIWLGPCALVACFACLARQPKLIEFLRTWLS